MTSTARRSSAPSPFDDDWKACAAPWKLVVIDAGSTWRASRCTASTASLRATPGLRLKEIVTAGSWPTWLTVVTPTPGTILDVTSSGTRFPFEERMDNFESAPE